MKRLVMILAAALPGAALAQPAATGAALGAAAFEACAACHTLAAGDNGVGPSLKGVFGRKAGTLEGFAFSRAMSRSDLTWTPEALDKFLADPQAAIPGNRMPFAGMPDAPARAALIAWLGEAAR